MDSYPFSMNSIATTSALWGLRNDYRAQQRSSGSVKIVGGNSRFPEKLAAALTSPIHLDNVVEEIHSSETDVTVFCTNGASFTADYALCTLPFSVLRHITISPPLEGKQKEAVDHLPYTRVTQVQLSVRQPFSKDDVNSLNMWTDSMLELIFPIRDESGQLQGFVAWANGANADKLDRLSTRDVQDAVKTQLQQIQVVIFCKG